MSTLPRCENYFLSEEDVVKGRSDESFKAARELERKASSSEWWGAFESMQKLFQYGCRSLSDERSKNKYLISVTHDEVTRGIIDNINRKVQAIYFERNIEGIDDALTSSDADNIRLAAMYKDSVPVNAVNDPYGPKVPDPISAQKLSALRSQCKSLLDEGQIFEYTVPWVASGKLDKKNLHPPAEWDVYLDTFCSDVLRTVGRSLVVDYTPPVQDDLVSELISQHDDVRSKLQNVGFSREDLFSQIMSYVKGEGDSASSSQFDKSKALVVVGTSGVGKSWIICQVR